MPDNAQALLEHGKRQASANSPPEAYGRFVPGFFNTLFRGNDAVGQGRRPLGGGAEVVAPGLAGLL